MEQGKVARLVEAARRVLSPELVGGADGGSELAEALAALTPADVALADGAEALIDRLTASLEAICNMAEAPHWKQSRRWQILNIAGDAVALAHGWGINRAAGRG